MFLPRKMSVIQKEALSEVSSYPFTIWEANFSKRTTWECFLAHIESLLFLTSLKLSSYSEQVVIVYVSINV